jgi:hypothetical protein
VLSRIYDKDTPPRLPIAIARVALDADEDNLARSAGVGDLALLVLGQQAHAGDALPRGLVPVQTEGRRGRMSPVGEGRGR